MRAGKMIVNLLTTEQKRDLQNREFVKVGNAIYKLNFVIAAVYMVCCPTFQSDLYLSKSLLFRGGVPVSALGCGESTGLKTRPSVSISEILNIQTSIKYTIAQRICIDKEGNQYPCP
jgi:hypothetical protein